MGVALLGVVAVVAVIVVVVDEEGPDTSRSNATTNKNEYNYIQPVSIEKLCYCCRWCHCCGVVLFSS